MKKLDRNKRNECFAVALSVTAGLLLSCACPSSAGNLGNALKAIDPSAAQMEEIEPPPPSPPPSPSPQYQSQSPYPPSGFPAYGGAPQSPPQANRAYSPYPGAPAAAPYSPYPGAPASPYGAPPAAATPQPAANNLQQYIPDFGKPLPTVPQSAYPAVGPGFAQGWAPAAPAAPPPPSYDEQRVAHLEKTAFGSTYPEHEIPDRLEHLEREVLGAATPDLDIQTRIGKLESKLGGGATNAFGGRTANAPPAQPAKGQRAYPAPNQQAARPQPNPAVAYQPPPPSAPPQYVPAARQMPSRYAYDQMSAPPAPPLTAAPPAPPLSSAPPQQQWGSPYPAAPPAMQTPYQAPPMTAGGPPMGYQTANVAPASPDFAVVVQSIPKDVKAGDYLAQIQHFGTSYAHWTSFPVRVHIPMNTPDNWKAALEKGITAWGRYIPVLIAPPQENADVEIGWINHLPPRELGITNLEIFNGRMRVTVYLLRPSYYPPNVPQNSLSHVAMHEVGHALGLFGHSAQPNDIMTALAQKSTSKLSPSARDLNTIRRVYESPALPPGFQSGQPISWMLLARPR